MTLPLYDGVVLRREATAGTRLLDLHDAQALATGPYVLCVQQGAHTGTVHVAKE